MEINENNYKSRRLIGEMETPSVISFLIKKGFAKSQQQAQNMVFIFVAVSFLTAIFLIGYYVVGIGSPKQIKYSVPAELKNQIRNNNILQ